MPMSLVTRAQFWCITLAAIGVGVPFTLLQAWSWRAATQRFDNWDSRDLKEHPST
jgi:hypothetical protein